MFYWLCFAIVFEAMFSGLDGLFVCSCLELFLFFVGLLCGGAKSKVRHHQVMGSLVLFVDVLNFVGVLSILVIGLLAIFRYS